MNLQIYNRDQFPDLFPRGEHPDKRTAKQFFTDVAKAGKLSQNACVRFDVKPSAKWYPRKKRGPKSC